MPPRKRRLPRTRAELDPEIVKRFQQRYPGDNVQPLEATRLAAKFAIAALQHRDPSLKVHEKLGVILSNPLTRIHLLNPRSVEGERALSAVRGFLHQRGESPELTQQRALAFAKLYSEMVSLLTKK